MVITPPSVKAAYVTHHPDELPESTREETVVVVHTATEKCSQTWASNVNCLVMD